jgi:hypothetical protein
MPNLRRVKPTAVSLDRASAVDPDSDADRAIAVWNADASRQMRGLLQAKTDTRAADRIDAKLSNPPKL